MARALTLVAVAAGLLAAAPVAPPPGAAQMVTRRYMPADRERDRYVYVPFDVPEGTTELRIRYEYDRAGGQNTIDLGVFEPGSLDLHTTAMRGYSGGAKSAVTIGECDSTPGYRAGPLPEGQWHVMLGLYQVADVGVGVTVTVDVARGSRCLQDAGGEGVGSGVGGGSHASAARWWSGALHTHTIHSDGAESPVDVLRRVHDAGLHFVTITDHNNTTHSRDVLRRGRKAFEGPLWIIGEEITTPGGHANAWGLPPEGWIDFRVRPHERRIGELVAAAHRQGALFSINHPAGECAGCGWEHEVPAGVDAIEIWNGRHGPQDRAVAMWEALLREGSRVTAVGASDWHRDPDPIDTPTVRVLAPALDQGAILHGIRAGRVIVLGSAAAATPEFTVRSADRTASVGDTLVLGSAPAEIDVHAPGLAGGHAVLVSNGARVPLPLDRAGRGRVGRVLAPGYARLEIYSAEGAVVAFTNPVFLTR